MMEKKYKIVSGELKQLISTNVSCIASDMITVDGKLVGYMYREMPFKSHDSGWRFFSGEENQEYTDNAENFAFYKINTIANYDPAIIPYIDCPVGSTLVRKNETDEFEAEITH